MYVCMVLQKTWETATLAPSMQRFPLINCRMSTCVYLYGMCAEEMKIKADVYKYM